MVSVNAERRVSIVSRDRTCASNMRAVKSRVDCRFSASSETSSVCRLSLTDGARGDGEGDGDGESGS